MMPDSPLIPLPTQPADVPWPTRDWPTGRADIHDELERLLDELVDDTDRYGTTYAVIVVHGGRIVAERYGGALPHFDQPPEPVTPDTPLLSWSIAKSILHAVGGILVRQGRLDVSAPAPIPEWQDDERAKITIDDLFAMRDGLAFNEDYEVGETSNVVEMLFGSGRHDVAGYAVARPLLHPPGTVFNYSSGTSNILSRIVGEMIGGGPEGIDAFMRQELFEPLGMTSPIAKFDDAGTFLASSTVYATGRDYTRFGLLYLRDGVWDGTRILPAGWVDYARRPRSIDPLDGRLYGALWYVNDDGLGTFRGSGFHGQAIVVVPARDLLVVRMGATDEALGDNFTDWRARAVDAFR